MLVSCSAIISPPPTQTEPIRTFTPVSTNTPLPTATATTVPLITEISCKPATNPFHNVDDFFYGIGLYPNITIARVCTFNGQISKGQVYKHQITENLIFCLIPSGIFAEVPDEGWSIVISDTITGSCDFKSENFANFGSIVTPPFRSNLFFYVYGWHFRNKENTGENDGSINAPQKERFFNFVFNRSDRESLLHAYRCREWAIDTECAIATQSSSKGGEIPRSRAKFTITKLELGNLVPNSLAWIEYMEFTVDVYLPAE